jgi:hypothetical protein
MEHDLAKAMNMKLILALFEQLPGLKIKFHKARDDENSYRTIFRCEVGSLPFK